MIKHEKNKWVLYNRDGTKKLSEHATEEEAIKREKQVNFFRALKEGKISKKQLRNKSLAK